MKNKDHLLIPLGASAGAFLGALIGVSTQGVPGLLMGAFLGGVIGATVGIGWTGDDRDPGGRWTPRG